MRRMNVLSATAVVAGLAFSVPAVLDAQVCAGYAAMPGSLSAGANVANPPGGSSLGMEASYNFTNPLGVFGSFNLVRPEGEANHSIIGGGVSYEVTDFVPIVPAWLSVCPLAGVSLSSVNGASTLTMPVGMGFGTTIPILPGAVDVMPFMAPQFVMTRVSVDDVSMTDHNFGIGFGALARVSNLYAGVTAGKEFVEAADIDVAFRAGVTIPLR
jgi:hypothetical protein